MLQKTPRSGFSVAAAKALFNDTLPHKGVSVLKWPFYSVQEVSSLTKSKALSDLARISSQKRIFMSFPYPSMLHLNFSLAAAEVGRDCD